MAASDKAGSAHLRSFNGAKRLNRLNVSRAIRLFRVPSSVSRVDSRPETRDSQLTRSG